MGEVEFKNRDEFADWLGELIYDTIGERIEDISGSYGYGNCEIVIETKKGDTISLYISMKNKDGEEK